MGEVECSIRLYGMLAGLGVCYLLAGGCRWQGVKSFLRPAEVPPDEFGGRNNCLWQSGCSSELSLQKSWFDSPEELTIGSKADSHSSDPQSFPRRGNLSILILWTLCQKAMGAEAECLILFFEGLGMCYLLVGG